MSNTTLELYVTIINDYIDGKRDTEILGVFNDHIKHILKN
jgi:hypothetical protein